jgi:cell division septation protein DedD
MLSSLGVVDFGQLLGLSEPARKAGRKTSVTRKPPAKKSNRVAAKLTQKTTNNKASDRAPLSKERRRVINRRSKPDTSTKKPIIVQEHSKPSASTQKEVVAGQPAEPATTAQELPMGRKPAEPVDPTHEPLVAKKPPEPSAPKVQPVVAKTASRSAEQTAEKAALAKGNVFPGERELSYPYSIYLGSYKTRERVERAISEYRNKGLSPYWVKVDLGDKGVWYRVFSGYFQKREQANEFIKKQQIAESKSRHTRYANLIGLFAFQKELDEEKLRLSKLGYCPYVIPSRNGESLLYVGAFYQKARAQRQHAELASKGIHSQIVER